MPNDYCHQFTLARSLKRHHHFYLGPTNSGKTYHALQTLEKAESGVYLAPLRLLAIEVRDRLMAAGVPCNLVTGEERVLIPGARHTASTIEMLNPARKVAVAVIDEIQMLQDPDRGAAWTAALIGVPAEQVFICGSNAVTAPCIEAIQELNESYEITMLERKTPLLMETTAICGTHYSKARLKRALSQDNHLQQHIQAGDAFIAFSRKDVLTLSARFRQWGFSVATIYGALSPEVRRTESERFNSGKADILVATDAIGMGLNLPIRRVVFTSIQKFDGLASRLLNATEVRQIAGRAGRYGIYSVGYVNVLEDHEQLHIEHMLATDDTASLTQLPVSISFGNVERVALHLHTRKLAEVLTYIQERIHDKAPPEYAFLAPASLNTQITQALLVDAYAPELSMKDKYIFTCAPVSLNVPFEKDYYLLCLRSVVESKPRSLPFAPDWLDSINAKYLEQAELFSQNLSLYAWLSFKFPQIFIEGSFVTRLRHRISRYIEAALLTQAGYGDTSREMDIVSRRK